jgi:hypothetical protein
MTDLGPHTRALLGSARDASEDEEMKASRERIRGSLGRKLGVAAVGLGVATTASTAGAGATASLGMGLLGKVLIGVAAVAISAGGVALTRKPVPPVALEPRASATGLPVVAAPPVPTMQTTAPTVESIAPVASVAPVIAQPPPANPSLTLGAPSAAPAKASITEELVAIRKANDALAAGNAAEAIAILDAAPATTLTEEHNGLRLLARCTLGHAGAPAAAKSFLAAHPSSPLAARLRVACAGF